MDVEAGTVLAFIIVVRLQACMAGCGSICTRGEGNGIQ